MTFNQISFKIFKANFRRYLIYYLCISFDIMVFFTYSTILTNKEFMNPYKLDSSITSMLYAPSVGIALFSIFFVVYTQTSFTKFRKSEYGLFMVLGMTDRDVMRMMILENSLIASISLITGLALGTVFSKIFHITIIKVINIQGISFAFTRESYLYTIIFFAAIYLLVIISNYILGLKQEIVNLLKHSRREDKNLLSNRSWAISGMVLVVIGLLDMLYNYSNEKSLVMLRSMGICYIGIYLFISNLVWIRTKLLTLFSRNSYKDTMFNANLKHTFGQTKKILFIITVLVTITIFFFSFALLFISDVKSFAVKHNPYDIAYAEIYGKNSISDAEREEILRKSKTPLTDYKAIEYIARPYLTILSDKNLNSNLGTNINVDKGCFYSLFQIVKNDGYLHKINELTSLNIETPSGTYTYKCSGSIEKMLFNNVPAAASGQYVILNSQDYDTIKIQSKPNQIGSIKLMSFKDWRKTEDVLKELTVSFENYNRENTLMFYNNINQDIRIFKPSSRIEDYLTGKQAGGFLMFLLSFVGVLFFLCSAILLHFKLLAEYETEKVKYRKLYKIGISDYEVGSIVSKELRVLFFLPVGIAFTLAAFYNCTAAVSMGKGTAALTYSLIVGAIYLVLQTIYYLLYSQNYTNKLVRDMGK